MLASLPTHLPPTISSPQRKQSQAKKEAMENQKQEAANYMSVPAFGDWDMKNGLPDYSMDFSKIREKRKMHKSDFSRASIGNEDELMGNHKRTSSVPDHHLPNAALVNSTGHSPVGDDDRRHIGHIQDTTKYTRRGRGL